MRLSLLWRCRRSSSLPSYPGALWSDRFETVTHSMASNRALRLPLSRSLSSRWEPPARLMGCPTEFPNLARDYANDVNDINPDFRRCGNLRPDNIAANQACVLGEKGSPQFLVWGDSYADAMQPAFEKLASEYGVSGRIVDFGGCPQLLGVNRADHTTSESPCREIGKAVINYVQDQSIKTVVLVSSWRSTIMPTFRFQIPKSSIDQTKPETLPSGTPLLPEALNEQSKRCPQWA